MGVLRELLDEFRSWRNSSPTPRRLLLGAAAAGMKEHPDPIPCAIPVGYDQPDTMAEMVQKYVRQEMSAHAKENAMGTFEEEDDFDLDDDQLDLPLSGYEVHEYEMVDEPESTVAPSDPPAPEPSQEPSATPAEPSPNEGEKP